MADRHQFRAEWHDYNEGMYFVTICCAHMQHYFGRISNGEMLHTTAGEVARNAIEEIPKHFKGVELHNYVVMPNHIHLVLDIVGTRHGASATTNAANAATHRGCLKPKMHDAPGSQDFHHNSDLAVVVGQFKGAVTRELNKQGVKIEWQERFYDNIIQKHKAYARIMRYVDTNIENWNYDVFNADHDDLSQAPWNNEPED